MTLSLRTGALLLAVLPLVGCNSLTATSVESLALLMDSDRNSISLERTNDARADTLLIKLDSAQALFEAPPGSRGRIWWYGPAQQLETYNGRITQLVGLETDVMTQPVDADPLTAGLLQVADGTQVTRSVDLPLTYQSGLQQIATYYRGPLEQIDFPGDLTLYQRIDEQVWMPQLKFRALNHYWIDPQTGSVRRSIQHPAPSLAVFDLLFTHQPARGVAP